MAREIRADGERWAVRLGDRPSEPGKRAVVFFCRTTHQRPYRVVEVPEDRFRAEDELEELSERELMELYRRSGSMGTPTSRAVHG